MNYRNDVMINLDLDLLRTFVLIADSNTYATAGAALSKTQSAVSQQMRRLELLTGTPLFLRSGRNKLLTEKGIQLLSYAKKLLRFNDETCASVFSQSVSGKVIMGISDDILETIFPLFYKKLFCAYPELETEIRVTGKKHLTDMLNKHEVDVVLTSAYPGKTDPVLLRTSPTLWCCAADYRYQQGDTVSLIVSDTTDNAANLAVSYLDKAKIPWRIAYVCTSSQRIRAVVQEGLGISALPIEMITPDIRIINQSEGLPLLPDTRYALCAPDKTRSEAVRAIFTLIKSLQSFTKNR